jgi:DNA modification methylase
MKTLQCHKSIVINSKFQEVANALPEKCADLVIADWPFNKGIVDLKTKRLLSDGVKLATRLLKNNGTFLSINYEEPNHEIWNEAKYWGLTYGDTIYIPRHPIKKVKFRLGYEIQPALVFVKGDLANRTLNCSCKEIYEQFIFSKSIMNILTNLWDEDSKFKNGFRRKNGDSVPEAMPFLTTNKLLSLLTPKNGLVVDFFGGAGTVPLACRYLDFKCISTEILEERFEIIKRRLSEKNKQLIETSSSLLDKAIENIESYTKGVENGKAEEREKGEWKGIGTEREVCLSQIGCGAQGKE